MATAAEVERMEEVKNKGMELVLKDSSSFGIERKPGNFSIPNESTWNLLQQAYQRVLSDADDDRDDDDREPTQGGFVVSYRVKHSPHKGRGVFSEDFVRKGDVVIKTGPVANFYTEDEWRKFLAQLPSALARDVAQWAYIVPESYDDPETDHSVMLDLYAGSLMNHGDTALLPPHSSSSANDPNMNSSLANTVSSSDGNIYASRDIESGEEFLTDYKLFHIKNHQLNWFDSIRNQLFTEDHGFKILSLVDDS
eukprot:CAMPEP_0194273520 /NCGR_PEP_ID=MMETSP0169-20130528/6846_1 /TAXON_ID=218684 /ORGANISM="Corethron pennatum, Strain L29A3" /LENGTH=251 /DNA_ID=CAMNT_0039016501 /DNA_START=98 /DNA_END=853 /DNA_ORIENTATION=-